MSNALYMNFLYEENVGEGKLIGFSEVKSLFVLHLSGYFNLFLAYAILVLSLVAIVTTGGMAQTTVSGSVFFDYTNDGFDTPSSAYTFTYGSYFVGDRPIEGITINAYDQNNTLFASTVTDANGDYTISNTSGIPLRLEIANIFRQRCPGTV